MTLGALFAIFGALIALEVPVAFAMGLSAVAVIAWQGQVPLFLLPQKFFGGLNTFALLAVPFFILTGEIMDAGGVSSRLVAFVARLVGHIRGGLGQVAIVAMMIMSGISGSGAADTSAVGGVMLPQMISRGYHRGFSTALLACAGALGPIIPPSITMIVYGSITGLSIAALFLSGILPGAIIGVGMMAVTYAYAGRLGIQPEARATAVEVWRTFREAALAVILPVVIIGGILAGVFTATEAGIVAALYALGLSVAVYRSLSWPALKQALFNTAVTSSMVMLVVSASTIFGWVLTREQFPRLMMGIMTGITRSPSAMIVLVMLLLLAIGCVVDILPAAVVFVPVLAPVGQAYGFDPIHFAAVVVFTLAVGGITPPVGTFLFVACGIAKVPMVETFRFLPAYLAMIVAMIALVAFFPPLATFLPRYYMGH
jgi:tripartite ATP-independent transporter DctM subunit